MAITNPDALIDSPVVSSGFGMAESIRLPLHKAVIGLLGTSPGLSVWSNSTDVLSGHPALSGITVLSLPAQDEAFAPTKGLRVLCLEEGSVDLESALLGVVPNHILSTRDDEAFARLIAGWGYRASTEKPWHYVLAKPIALLRALNQPEWRDRLAAVLPDAIEGSTSSAECVELAYLSEQAGDSNLRFRAIERATSLDRNNPDALVMMAAASLGRGQHVLSLLCLDELVRLGALPEGATALHARLNESLGTSEIVRSSRAANGLDKARKSATTRRILVVTNLFPPQELGGYGRQLWEFARGLGNRGHEVSVLSGDEPSLAKAASPSDLELEPQVQRTLRLTGTWGPDGGKYVGDAAEIARRVEHNTRVAIEAVRSTRAEVVLLGNLDFLGVSLANAILESGIPVVHALGLSSPGYTTEEQPMHPNYCLASGSHWLANQISNSGYFPARSEVIYPGARTDSFFKLIRPDRSRLRICYAGLVMPYKGVHALVDAAVELADKGVDFTLEIAGDSLTPDFVATLRAQVEEAGISNRVTFTGFLDRAGLNALFARSNVLVFPSICNEVFGISQVEALASGLVVVTTATGGAREIVRHNVDGLHFDAKSPNSLTEALTRLAREPELFARLQEAAQPRAMGFSTSHSVTRIESCIEQMLANA